MKIFICEFITCGGLVGQPLAQSLLREGSMMLKSLLHDLAELEEYDVLYTLDARITDTFTLLPAEYLNEKNVPNDTWRKYFQKSDACIIVAPETDDILEQLVSLASECDCQVLGCKPDAINVCSRKSTAYNRLKNKILQPETCLHQEHKKYDIHKHWVLKPDDGAGSEHCYRIHSTQEITEYTHSITAVRAWIVQEYIDGEPGSLSIFSNGSETYILAVNKMLIKEINGEISLQAIEVNGLSHYKSQLQILVDDVITHIPGLVGFFGIDFIYKDDAFYLIDINPRITTAYVGLYDCLEVNPLKLFQPVRQNTDPHLVIPDHDNSQMVNI